MTDKVGQPGRLAISRGAFICDACEAQRVQRGMCLAGPNGYVMLCFACAGRWLLQATLDENGTGIRACSVVL